MFDASSGKFVPLNSVASMAEDTSSRAAATSNTPGASQHIDWTSELPVPFGIQRIASARFDRLTLSQQFVLRLAAVLCVGAGRGCIEFDIEAVLTGALVSSQRA